MCKIQCENILKRPIQMGSLCYISLGKNAIIHHASRAPVSEESSAPVVSRCFPGGYNLIIARVLARVIIKVSGHQHQWFPGVSQVVTM